MNLLDRFLLPVIRRRVDLAVRALDDSRDYRLGGRHEGDRDRFAYERDEILKEALEAWRTNPMARRIVELMTQYVVGAGLEIVSKDEYTNKFIKEWWNHRLNRLPVRIFEWCDELTRSGELYIAISTDAAGMSYLRTIPAVDIQEIVTAENDLAQELQIIERPDPLAPSDELRNGRIWQVYDQASDERRPDGSFPPVMVHYAVNRVPGGRFGESDLAPLLKWIKRYAAWLEDRARLNRFRFAFMYVVQAKFKDAAERLRRQAELNAYPPNPGSILVADESEKWSVMAPSLSSFESSEDGLSLKKMIAVGSGNPLHFLSEPESTTKTTAESAGGPTFRHYQQRQIYFLWLIHDLTLIALRRRAMVAPRIRPEAPVKVSGPDVSSRDNTELAEAAATILVAFADLRNRGIIDDPELLRVVYRFAGEVVDVEEMIRRGKIAGKVVNPPPTPQAPGGWGSGDNTNEAA